MSRSVEVMWALADLVLAARAADRLRCWAPSCSAWRRRRKRPASARSAASCWPPPTARCNFTMLKEFGLPDRARHRDGLLPVHRLVDLLRGLRRARRAAGGRAVLPVAQPVADRLPAAHAGHHLPARLAAGMDRDHHHLRADLPAAARRLRHRPDLLRHPGGAQHADRLQHAAGGDGGVLPQGRGAAAREADRHLQRRAAVRVHGVRHHGRWSTSSRGIALWLPDYLYTPR